MGGAMDFITPAMWAMKLLLTKVIEKNGEKLGETGANLLGKLTNDIGKKISAESAQELADQPENVLLSPNVIAEIAGVIKNSPEVATDLQNLSAEVNRNIQLVLAMEKLLKRGNYDSQITKQIAEQLEKLKWDLNHPPTQINDLTFPDGIVPINCPFYVGHDEIQTRCQQTITQKSGLLRIQSPHQMGKTSLLERLVIYAQKSNYRVVRIDLRQVERATMQDLDRLLQWLCRQVCKQSNVSINIADRWDPLSGGKENCTDFIEQILDRGEQPLLLCIDNLELIFSYPEIMDDFLSLLRSWHDKGNTPWTNLRIILLHVWYIESEDSNHSPFNVGERVRLPEFTPIQVQNLVVSHGLNWHDRHVADLIGLVSGHPFLIRLALYEVAHRKTLLHNLLVTADREDGLYSEHLQRHFRYLEREAELKQIMRKVVHNDRPVFIPSTSLPQLRDSGLIKVVGDCIEPANQLYRSYFRQRL
jgi:hypothetical protein